jgi:phosphoglycolate phosphatase
MCYHVVIFDLDGTLLNTLEDIADTANGVLAGKGFPTYETDAYRLFIGEGVGTLFRRSLPADKRTEKMVTECVKAFRENYANNWKTKTRPYEGIPELLTALTDRGVKMAVLSNKPDVFTKRCVYELLPDWNFAMVVGEREGVPRKPDPTAALAMADGMGVEPSRVLYVGDSSIDMKTAARSGFFPVGVLWGYRSRDELKDNGARALIDNPMELMNYLAAQD